MSFLMRRSSVAAFFVAAAACAPADAGSVRPAASEVYPAETSTLVTLPDGRIVFEEEGRLLALDPADTENPPRVVGPALEVGEVHAAVPMDGAILVLASGGTFILRGDAWVTSPLASALDAPIRDALLLPTPTGRGTGDLWILTESSLYRVVDMVAERLSLSEDLGDAELAMAQRPEGPALWVRLPDRVLEVWRDRSGVIRSAGLVLESTPEAIGGDATLRGWVELDGRLHSIGADRRLIDHGTGLARLISSPLSDEVWVITDEGEVRLHADDAFYVVEDATLSASDTMALATDGSLYVAGSSIRRFAPRHRAGVVGPPDGSLLVRPETFLLQAEGAPAIEARLNGQDLIPLAEPLRLELTPTELGEGSYELVVRFVYDDGTLPGEERRSFEVITNATWSADVLPLYEAYCADCHGPEGPANTRLDSPSDWSGSFEGILTNVVEGRMPLGRSPLTQREIALIQAWEVAGFAE